MNGEVQYHFQGVKLEDYRPWNPVSRALLYNLICSAFFMSGSGGCIDMILVLKEKSWFWCLGIFAGINKLGAYMWQEVFMNLPFERNFLKS